MTVRTRRKLIEDFTTYVGDQALCNTGINSMKIENGCEMFFSDILKRRFQIKEFDKDEKMFELCKLRILKLSYE